MSISILGTGRMGQGLVRVISPHVKEDLIWGSRTPEKVKRLIQEHGFRNVREATYADALQADVIVHSFWYRDLLPWAQEHAGELAGKILIDIANPFTEDFQDFTTALGTSAAEELQKRCPQRASSAPLRTPFSRCWKNRSIKGCKAIFTSPGMTRRRSEPS
ncbi:NAD(P)-binding domain-containing protein [Paenibacillus sp. P25]|nr:NAD(P)-binding domain-containing protein [Paenibacillus sp. P25]